MSIKKRLVWMMLFSAALGGCVTRPSTPWQRDTRDCQRLVDAAQGTHLDWRHCMHFKSWRLEMEE